MAPLSQVLFMGEHSHISMDFDKVSSLNLFNNLLQWEWVQIQIFTKLGLSFLRQIISVMLENYTFVQPIPANTKEEMQEPKSKQLASLPVILNNCDMDSTR